MLQISFIYYVKKIPTYRFKYKITSLLGKKNKGKKTPREDDELGYSDFTLALTFDLPQPQQKYMKFSPMHKSI